MEKVTYEVQFGRFNADPDFYGEYDTFDEALSEYEIQKLWFYEDIKSALKRRARLLSDLSDRSVHLNKLISTYSDDGECDDVVTERLYIYGTAADWDAIREELKKA